MTFRIIMSRPECIIHLNGNKNDENKGIINTHALIAHLFCGPPIASNEAGRQPSWLWALDKVEAPGTQAAGTPAAASLALGTDFNGDT